ncbi:MAG: hypothetical protein ACYTEO_19120 [Planctomycetota bacterium]|jgi:hypothetical protein
MAKKKRRRGKRKILPMLIDSTGAIHAGLSALGPAQAGDMEGAGKAFVGQLTANYAGYNVSTNTMDLPALFIGYGPPVIRKLVSRMGVRINWPF